MAFIKSVNNILLKLSHQRFLILALSFLYYLSYIFWGLDDDIFFWCNGLSNYSSDYTVTFSLWVGYLWSTVFGNSILSVRVLALLFSTITILMLFLYTFPHNTRYKNLPYLSTAFLFSASSINIMYRADTLTIFTAAILYILLMERHKGITFRNTIFLSIISAIAISSRFPNIVILLFIPVIDLWANRDTLKHTALNILLYLFVSILSYYILQATLTGNIYWPSELSSTMSAEKDATHSVSMLIGRYYSTLSVSLFAFAKALLIFVLPVAISHKLIKNRYVTILVSVLVLLYLAKMVMSQQYWPFPPISGWDRFVSFCLLSLLIITAYFTKTGKFRFYPVIIYTILMAYCIAGSDTGILKIFPFAVILAPIILYNFFNRFIPLNDYKYTILPLFVIIGMYFSYKHHDREEHQLQTMTQNHFYPQLKNVLLAPENNAVYDKFYHDLNTILKDNPCVFYGAHHGHWMYYLSGKSPLYKYSYLMSSNNKKELSEVISVMRTYPDCYLIDSSEIKDPDILKYLSVIKTDDDYTIYQLKEVNIHNI